MIFWEWLARTYPDLYLAIIFASLNMHEWMNK